MCSTVITDYFNERNAAFNELSDGSFRMFSSLFDDSRFSCCELLLRPSDRLEITYVLPLRCLRKESEEVYQGLNEINSILDDNRCFEIDMLFGAMRYRCIEDMPEDTEELDKILNSSCAVISHFSDEIIGLVLKASDKRSESSGILDRFFKFLVSSPDEE